MTKRIAKKSVSKNQQESDEKKINMRDFLTINTLLLSRSAQIMRGLLDPAGRDLDKDCGYPLADLAPQGYWQLYNKEGIAARVVGVYPDECWSVYPEMCESEDDNRDTEFEKRWDEICFEHNIWHYLHRIDELSGIGRYGVILLGLDDGRDLIEPVEGINEYGMRVGNPQHNITYIRAFDESNVYLGAFETNPSNPRYAQPLYYNVNFLDPSGYSATAEVQPSQIGIHKLVHWSRIIHIADNRKSSEIFGMPRMRQVVNRLLDVRKILAGSAEMFWKGAFPGYSLETLPQLGTEVRIDQESIAEELEQYYNGLKRYIAMAGMTAKSLAPQVSDPTNHLEQQFRAICATIGVPMRIFLGSEAGHLASTQDSGTWNRRLARRQQMYLTPMLVKPFVQRLMVLGILPQIKRFYVNWTDLNAMSDKDRADVSLKRTQAMMQYVAGGVEQIMAPMDYLMKVLEFSPEEAKVIIKAAKKGAKKPMTALAGQMAAQVSLAGHGGRKGNPNAADVGSPGTESGVVGGTGA